MKKGDVSVPVEGDPRFEAFYRSQLEPLEDPIESHRLFALSESRRRMKAAGIALLASTILIGITAYPGLRGFWFFYMVAVLMAGTTLGVWVFWPRLSQTDQQKLDVASRVVPFYGDLEFVSSPNLDLGRFANWAVLPKFDFRQATDQIRGCHLGVPFTATPVTLLEKRRTKSGFSSVPVYEGIFCEFRLPRKVRGKTVFGSSEMFHGIFERKEPELVSLGRWSFDFEVFSSDEEESRTLLTQDFLLALGELRDSLEVERLIGSFHKDRLVILIDREGDDLEVTLDSETDLREYAEKIRRHLARLLGIIDILGLEPVLEPGKSLVPKSDATRESLTESQPEPARSYEGWGFFFYFVAFALLVALYSSLARDRVPDVWLAAAAGGATMITLGFAGMLYRKIKR